MSFLPLLNGSIHGIQSYVDFTPVIDFSSLQAFIPFVYVLPTIGIMITILVMYANAKRERNSASMDGNVFTLIMLYFFFNSLFFIGDYLRFNLPSSGLVTSHCAQTNPNRWYGLVIIYTYASNYGTITCPFLVCLQRLTILISPRHSQHYADSVLHWFSIPFLFITPILLVLCNFHIHGYCRQLGRPFSFGSLIIYEGDDHYYTNTLIHFIYSCSIMFCTFMMSSMMLVKLRMTVPANTSARTKELKRKIELSLSLTMLSGLVPFITNTIVSLTFVMSRDHWCASLVLHPFGNDFETVMMPWVLFFTHPLFRGKKVQPKLSTSSVVQRNIIGR